MTVTVGNTIGGFVADQVAGSSDDPPTAKGKQYAQTETRDAMGRPVVTRTDYVAESEPDIILTARRLGEEAIKKARGFFGWLGDGINRLTGFTNLGGHHPHKSSTSSNVVSYSFYQPGVRTGSGYDRMGQPLMGRSNYDAVRQFNNIISDSGSASLGTTFKRLGEWGTYTVPDAAQRNAEIWDPYRGMTPKGREFASTMDRLEGGTISGISTGVSIQLGADRATQDLVYGLGSAGDGLLIAGGSMAGARVPGIGNQLELNIVNGENGVHGNSLLSGRTTYLYELQTKTGEFLKYGISVNPATRYTSSFMRDKDIYPIASGTRADMTALEANRDLQPWAAQSRALGGQSAGRQLN